MSPVQFHHHATKHIHTKSILKNREKLALHLVIHVGVGFYHVMVQITIKSFNSFERVFFYLLIFNVISFCYNILLNCLCRSHADPDIFFRVGVTIPGKLHFLYRGSYCFSLLGLEHLCVSAARDIQTSLPMETTTM